jgi:hypothetical protein
MDTCVGPPDWVIREPSPLLYELGTPLRFQSCVLLPDIEGIGSASIASIIQLLAELGVILIEEELLL